MTEEKVGAILFFVFFVLFWMVALANHRDEAGDARMGKGWFYVVLFFYPALVGWIGFQSMKMINLEGMPGMSRAYGVVTGLMNFGVSLIFRWTRYFWCVHKRLER